MNRGTDRLDRPQTPLQFREERSDDYTRELRRFLADVVGDRDAIRGGDDSQLTYLTAAAYQLARPPTFGSASEG